MQRNFVWFGEFRRGIPFICVLKTLHNGPPKGNVTDENRKRTRK